MKKNFVYAMIGAIALTGAVSLSACSSSDEIVDNPDFNPETNAVKTELAISVNHPENRTRMVTAKTQQDGTFQGMTSMYLFALNNAPSGTDYTFDQQGFTAGKFDLGSLSTTDISASKSSKIYTMYVPVGTKHFLFYGKNDISGTAADKGSLTYTVDETTANINEISFSLNPIVTNVEANVTTPASTLAGYMNTIENTTVTIGEITYSWAGTADDTNIQYANAQYTALKNAYVTFTSIPGSSSRQGSSVAILRQVQDLYRVMYEIANTASNIAEVKAIANAVIDNITGTNKGFKVKNETSGTTAVLEFTSTDTKVTNFPEEAGLPAGSAVLLYDNAKNIGQRFSQASYKTTAIFGATPSTDMGNINTPAEIVYYDNSPLRASNKSLTADNFADGANATPSSWETASNWTTANGWEDEATVTAATRAVAMKYNIKYGVALLSTTVKLGASVTTLQDNSAALDNETETNKNITGANLKLTGVIIGGQPTSSDWQFLPAASAEFNQTVYDPITPVALSTTATTANYTLLLDNYAATAATVNVALEFLNDDQDFYGKDGLIAKGQKFYLVGALNVSNGSGTLSWPDGIPQKNNQRVFIQDFLTTANFTLDNGDSTADPVRKPSLQNAYSVIPDLRSTQMLFGLSVNLSWTPGLTYNVNL